MFMIVVNRRPVSFNVHGCLQLVTQRLITHYHEQKDVGMPLVFVIIFTIFIYMYAGLDLATCTVICISTS